MTVEEWLGEDNQLGTDIWTKKYCNDGENFESGQKSIAMTVRILTTGSAGSAEAMKRSRNISGRRSFCSADESFPTEG